MADTTPEEVDSEIDRWDMVLTRIHAELMKPNQRTDPRLVLMNEQLGAAIHITKTHDVVLEKLCSLILSLQERAYMDRKAQAERIRDLQLKIVEMKKLRTADKKTQDGIITRNFFEKMVSIEEDKNDVNWLKGSLKIVRMELEKKGERLELLHADIEEKDDDVKSAREYCKFAVEVSTESEEMEESKKDLRRIWDHLDKKKGKKESEYSESHKEIFNLIESLDLLSDTPVYFRNMPEESKQIVESFKQNETSAAEATSQKPQKPAADEIEQMENYSKSLEFSTSLLKQQHRQAVDQLEGDFARNVTEVKEKYEGYRKKYEEEAMKVREKDREISELNSVKENLVRKLVKANKRTKRIEGMVFLNENIKHIYNSIEYKDGIVAALDLRIRMSEQARIMDIQKYLIWQRDMQLAILAHCEPNNAKKREAVIEEYKQKQLEIRPLDEQLIVHQTQMNEYRRNEAWLNQTRKCFEINEDHLKSFIAEVPRNVNRLKYGRVEPDSIEAQMLDVQAWARECYRFKQLAETLLAQRKKLDAELSNMTAANRKMAADIAILQFRHKTIEKVVEQKIKMVELENTRIIQWFFITMVNDEPVLRQLLIQWKQEIEQRMQEQRAKASQAPGTSSATSDKPEETSDIIPEPTLQGARFGGDALMPQLRALYYTHQSNLLNAILAETQYMRERAKAGLPMRDEGRLAGIVVALHRHSRVRAELVDKITEDMTLRSHWSFFVNPKAWKLNETVETQMIKEMQERICELETSLVEMKNKLEEKEKEVVEKTNHVRIVEGVYLRCRYGTQRVQVSPGRKKEP